MPEYLRQIIRPGNASPGERVTKSTYYWDSRHRGQDEYVIFQLTESGSGIFELQGKEFVIPAGHAFVAIAPEDSSYRYEDPLGRPWEFSWMNFLGDHAVELFRMLRSRFGNIIPLPRNSPAAGLFRNLIRKHANPIDEDEYEASSRCYHFVMTLLSQLDVSQSTGKAAQSIDRIARLLQRQSSAPLLVKEMAELAGLSREHFSREFRKITGTTPAKMRRDRQLEIATEWLIRSNLTIEEVALRSGYQSGRQLSKAFRLHKGHTPLELRERGKNSPS